MRLVNLPVDGLIPDLKRELARSSSVIVEASPGSGKTTRIPPALLRDHGEVLVLEPRRVAAKFAALRVADEMGTKIGDVVGYQFRFENVSSPKTRLRFLTEGMLMRRFLSDPELHTAHTVILDEFHERHLHGDLALACLRRLQLTTRPDLKVVVMSATLDSQSISKFLGDAPVIKIDAPLFPVEIEYFENSSNRYLDLLVRDAVKRVIGADIKQPGHILVFLPGMADIRRCTDTLSTLAEENEAVIAPLHGELSREEQDLAIERSARRKIILATNVAETSLTIEGVSTVIDSGLHRIASYSWWSGVPTLRTRPISRASAIQRAGRAGRTGPGRCIRLYGRGDFEGWAPFQTPEIQRADLTQSVLELKSLGITELRDLGWFEAPPAQALETSEKLLYRLGALQKTGGELTELGRAIARIPAHPRIGRMLMACAHEESGSRDNLLGAASLLAALISEGDLDMLGNPDVVTVIESASGSAPRTAHGGVLSERVRRLADQLKRSVTVKKSGAQPDRPAKNLSAAVLSGFPDRIAKRKPNGDLLFSEGGSAKAPETPLFRSSEFFVLLDAQERQGYGQIKSSTEVKAAVAIEPDWLLDLEPTQVEEQEELGWDPDRKRVQFLSRLQYGQITLSESKNEPPRDTAHSLLTSRILAKEGLGLDLESWGTKSSLQDALRALGKIADPEHPEKIEIWAARVGLLRRIRPEILVIDAAFLRECTEQILGACVSLEETRGLDWEAGLTSCLQERNPGIISELEQWTPTHFQLPNGRRVPIHYEMTRSPWIESRLQDFFGTKTPPTILRGQLALALHLLAPNQRAVQVTSDLPGFWSRIYPEIRNELSRRYPRHSWPEDPSKAEAADSKIKPKAKR